MATIGSGHYLTGTIAFDFASGVACRTLSVVALMGNVTATELDRGWVGKYRAVRGGLVTVKDQITLHGLARKTSASIVPVSR